MKKCGRWTGTSVMGDCGTIPTDEHG